MNTSLRFCVLWFNFFAIQLVLGGNSCSVGSCYRPSTQCVFGGVGYNALSELDVTTWSPNPTANWFKGANDRDIIIREIAEVRVGVMAISGAPLVDNKKINKLVETHSWLKPLIQSSNVNERATAVSLALEFGTGNPGDFRRSRGFDKKSDATPARIEGQSILDFAAEYLLPRGERLRGNSFVCTSVEDHVSCVYVGLPKSCGTWYDSRTTIRELISRKELKAARNNQDGSHLKIRSNKKCGLKWDKDHGVNWTCNLSIEEQSLHPYQTLQKYRWRRWRRRYIY